MSELYSKAELAELTDAETVPGQVRWLEARGIPHRVEFIGAGRRKRLIVSRHHVRLWLEGGTTAQRGQPNWNTVR